MKSISVTITPGALRRLWYKTLRTDSNQVFPRSLHGSVGDPCALANSQKHQVLFVTRHLPSDPPQWVINGSLLSCFIFILTLTHSLICMLHRTRESLCREISHHKVKGKVCLAVVPLVASAHPLTFYIPFSFPSRSNGLICNQETVLGAHGMIMMGICHKG